MCRPCHIKPQIFSIGARRLMNNPMQRGDCTSVPTQSTPESSISENRLRLLQFSIKSGQKPSPRTSQLFQPNLDHDVDCSFWPSKFTATMYIIVAVALVLGNHRVLCAIFLGFLFQMIKLIMKWGSFVVEDIRARMPRSGSLSDVRSGLLMCLVFFGMIEEGQRSATAE